MRKKCYASLDRHDLLCAGPWYNFTSLEYSL
jgi:hypothetical protein